MNHRTPPGPGAARLPAARVPDPAPGTRRPPPAPDAAAPRTVGPQTTGPRPAGRGPVPGAPAPGTGDGAVRDHPVPRRRAAGAQGTGATSVLVVDDHLLLSTTLVTVLRGAGLLAAACSPVDAENVLHRAAHRPPGLVLLDLDLGTGPDGTRRNGTDLIEPLRADGWQVIVVTGTTDEAGIAGAVARGAIGWIRKDVPVPDLLRMVTEAAAGRPIMDRAEHERLLEVHRHHQRAAREKELTVRALARLSRREREVLDKLAAGRRAGQIAGEFVVSVSTVRSQIRAILTKLEVNSQLEAVALYRRATGG